MGNKSDIEERIWESLASELDCPKYWYNNTWSDWNAIGFFAQLIKTNMVVDRRTSYSMLDNDLIKLERSFIHDKNIPKKVQAIKKGLSKNKESLNQFWATEADDLCKSAYTEYLDMQKVQYKYIQNVSSTLLSQQQELPTTSTSKPPEKRSNQDQVTQNQKKKQKNKLSLADITENDQVFVTDNNISVGTIIKRAAYDLHMKFKSNPKLSPRERKVMTSGLSSILDLSDDSFTSQRTLFEESEWEELKTKYDTMLTLPSPPVNINSKDSIIIALNTLELSGDFNCTIQYLQKMQYVHNNSYQTRNLLKVAEVILNVIERYDYLLMKKPTKDVTELDYFRIIWSPIFEALFQSNRSIRIKSGESVNQYSTQSKKNLYHEQSYVKGFKIDFRILLDIDSEELDLVVGECAKNDEDDKMVNDEGKLSREAKDSHDAIVTYFNEDYDVITYAIQTIGPCISISTIHLVANGLYVFKHRYSYSLTSSISDLQNNIHQLLLNLSAIVNQSNQVVDKVMGASQKRQPIDNSLNRASNKKVVNKKLAYLRDTYYTPPRLAESKVPQFFYTSPTFANNNTTTNEDSRKGKQAAVEPNVDDIEDGDYDKLGYKKLKNGSYYNRFLKKVVDYHPDM